MDSAPGAEWIHDCRRDGGVETAAGEFINVQFSILIRSDRN